LASAAALWSSGRHAEAEGALRSALDAAPEDASVLRFLGEICEATGRRSEAVALWRRLVALSPNDPGALRKLAAGLLSIQSAPEAIDLLRRAISLEPANARAYNNLGLAQLRGGDAAAAVQSLEQAIAIDPTYELAHMNLGLAHQAGGQNEEARSSCERALELDPFLVQARMQLSELLRATDPEASRRERDRALECHATNLMTVRRHEDAIPVWTQLIDSGAEIRHSKGNRFHCQLFCCDWTGYAERIADIEAQVLRGESVDRPFSFFVYSNSPAAQLQCAQSFIADRHPASPEPAPRPPRSADIRIKVAYLSFDLQEHATAYLIAGLFEAHDRSRFEITALSYGPKDESAMRQRLEASVERFVDVSRSSDREVVDLARRLGVHIAVDLKGFTGGARTGIFAARAAPVQVNFLGYPGTMGAAYIDYIIADRHVIPPAEEIHYSERVILMPHCYQPNDARRPLPTSALNRADLGLPAQGFVFCCFNNLYKIAPVVYAVWMQLLRRVEGSVLWLLEGTKTGMRNLRAAAAAQGIAPERILFAPHIELARHLERYRHADLFLDTTPCNAHTTASDALWMAVPVLTLAGRTFASRVASSLLQAVGLERLCASSLEDYAALALRLAQTPAELAALKAHLERGRSTFSLFDTAAYCRQLEAAYGEIHARYQRGEPPASILVQADCRVSVRGSR
jgi:protein O-GlcNAc transferase